MWKLFNKSILMKKSLFFLIFNCISSFGIAQECSIMLEENLKIFSSKKRKLKGKKLVYALERPQKWNGKTLVFVPGFSRGLGFWEEHKNYYLKKGYQVFRYDPFNVGRTLALTGVQTLQEGYEFTDDILILSEVFETLDLQEELILVGHSLGSARSIFLAHELQKKHPEAIKKLLLASPFIKFLGGYYQDKKGEELAEPFLFWNPFGFVPVIGAGISDGVDIINSGIKRMGQEFSSAQSKVLTPLVTKMFIDGALSERNESEKVPGLGKDLEQKALKEIMKSLENINVLDILDEINSDIHLLTGDDEEVIVPDELLEEFKEATDKRISHKIIGSDHFTPSKKEYYQWLNLKLRKK